MFQQIIDSSESLIKELEHQFTLAISENNTFKQCVTKCCSLLHSSDDISEISIMKYKWMSDLELKAEAHPFDRNILKIC